MTVPDTVIVMNRALVLVATLVLSSALMLACNAATSAPPATATPTPTPTLTTANATPEATPAPVDDVPASMWEDLVRPVLEEGAEAVVRLAATVPARCSFHGELLSACERAGKGLHEQFDGIILSDLLFCEGCERAPEDVATILQEIYALGPLELESAWRTTPNVATRLEDRGDGVTASLAFAFTVPSAPSGDYVTGFLLYVDPSALGAGPDAKLISAIDVLTPSWTGADTAQQLGGWQQVHSVTARHPQP